VGYCYQNWKQTRSGGSQKETVVRGKSALNAAQRNGAVVGTRKVWGWKFRMSLSSHLCCLQSLALSLPWPPLTPLFPTGLKPGVEGQHLTKVDRSEDIVKLKQVGTEVGRAISRDVKTSLKAQPEGPCNQM
jgi:putative transcription factor